MTGAEIIQGTIGFLGMCWDGIKWLFNLYPTCWNAIMPDTFHTFANNPTAKVFFTVLFCVAMLPITTAMIFMFMSIGNFIYHIMVLTLQCFQFTGLMLQLFSIIGLIVGRVIYFPVQLFGGPNWNSVSIASKEAVANNPEDPASKLLLFYKVAMVLLTITIPLVTVSRWIFA